MSFLRGRIWILLTLGLVLPLGLQDFAQTTKKTHKVIIYPTANDSIDQLKAQGVTNIDNYGSFWVAETDDAQAQAVRKLHGDRAVNADYLNRIELRAAPLDTSAGEPSIPSTLRHAEVAGKRLRLVQFKGPTLPEWVSQLKAAGDVKVVTYIPNNAYLVWLDQPAEKNLNKLKIPDGPIQWIGSYHPYYKLARFNQKFTGGPLNVNIAVVDGPEADQTIASVSSYGLEPRAGEHQVLNQRVFRLTVMPNDLPQIARLPDVLWIEPVVPNISMDEKQDLIMTSQTNALPGHAPSPGVGQYLDFLTNVVGFSTDGFDYPIVDVADTGLDNYGFPTNAVLVAPHPAFREFGVGPFRIAYLFNLFDVPANCVPLTPCPGCVSCGPYDALGHGTLVSSILLGYDDLGNQSFDCITRSTASILFGTNIVCPPALILTTNICFPTQPVETCTNIDLVTCPSAGSTNVLITLPNVQLVTNVFTVQHRDTEGFQDWLGVSPFGRFGSSKIFSDCGGGPGFFLVCPHSQLSGVFGVPITTLELMVGNAYLSRARIQNNSWSESLAPGPTGNAGAYDGESLSYDTLVRDALSTGSTNPPTPGPSAFNQEFVAVFAGGNDNGIEPTSFGDVLVTPPGTAKNVITVGASENVRPVDGCDIFASDSDNSFDLSFFSSFGPTEDGRFKPEIVAPGSSIHGALDQLLAQIFGETVLCADSLDPLNSNSDVEVTTDLNTCGSGTSFSAPAVTGAAQLFWWYFINRLGNTNQPSPAMIKAYMANSARYLTGQGANDDLPSNAQGMGEIDLARMFDSVPRILRDEQPFFSFLEIPPGPTNYIPQLFSKSGQSYELSGQVADATKPFRVTLAWTDAPGNPAAFKQLQNDLDLQVTIRGVTYKGNVFTGPNSIPGGSFDNINNMESVFLPAGQTGTWSVIVRASNISADGVPNKGSDTDQDMALVVYNGINPSDAPNLSTNDSCATATDIFQFPYHTALSLKPPVFHNTMISPSAARGGIEAFWRIPRPTAGTGFTVDTAGSNFPTLLSIWQVQSGAGFGLRRAECGQLVELISQNSGSGTGAQVTFTADGTNAYYIVVEGVNGATGTVKLNVAATLPPITLTPTGLDFGPLFVGQTSDVQSVTLQNASPELINVDNIQISGTNASDFFLFSDLCTGANLAMGGTCQMFVQFSPTGVGLRTAELVVFDDATGSPQMIPLTGIGLVPAAVTCANSGSLTFTNTAVGFASAPQTATITNCGLAALFITNAVLTGSAAGDYVISSDACSGNSIAPGSSCDIGITFAPTTTGARSATLQVNSSATNSPTAFILSGTGRAPAPLVCVGANLTFGGQEPGTTSAVQNVTVTNCGEANLVVSGATVTGANASDFVIVSDICTNGPIATNSTCTIGLVFIPGLTNIANRTATLQITDNAAGSPQTVTLSGTAIGSQPDVLISKKASLKKALGAGIINNTGNGQTLALTVGRGKNKVFYIAFQNAGIDVDNFLVDGGGNVPGQLTVNYFVGSKNFNGFTNQVTSAVVANSYSTSSLAAGAITGDATMLRLQVNVSPTAAAGTNDILITAQSSINPSKVDTVRARVIVR